ncbi:hypothetical protein STXM2123_3097 [Streptomyces sp. F-3]|nr:hypothetical protein STXM2123_3097 [Streptomyces sp. F-3]
MVQSGELVPPRGLGLLHIVLAEGDLPDVAGAATAGAVVLAADALLAGLAGGVGEGGRNATVDVRVDEGSLSLIPGEELLTGEDTRHPVCIDPSVEGSRHSWSIMYKKYPDTPFFNGAGLNGGTTPPGWDTRSGPTAPNAHKVELRPVGPPSVSSGEFPDGEDDAGLRKPAPPRRPCGRCRAHHGLDGADKVRGPPGHQLISAVLPGLPRGRSPWS